MGWFWMTLQKKMLLPEPPLSLLGVCTWVWDVWQIVDTETSGHCSQRGGWRIPANRMSNNQICPNCIVCIWSNGSPVAANINTSLVRPRARAFVCYHHQSQTHWTQLRFAQAQTNRTIIDCEAFCSWDLVSPWVELSQCPNKPALQSCMKLVFALI